MRLRFLTLAAAALALLLPPAAQADTLVQATPEGSQNLTAGGGYMAWAQPKQPAGSGFRLVVREPDDTVTTPQIPVFEDVPDPAIGSDQFGFPRALLLVYARGGDVYSYDLRTKIERKVTQLSSRAVERTPVVEYGRWQFVRVNGSRPGVYAWSAQSGLRRITRDTPRELAGNGSRVAYPRGNSIVIRRISGRGRPAVVRTTGRPRSIVLARYRASWLVGDEAFKTSSFGGSGRPEAASSADKGARPLTGANSIAFGRGDLVQLMLDREGVKRLNPTPFGSRG